MKKLLITFSMIALVTVAAVGLCVARNSVLAFEANREAGAETTQHVKGTPKNYDWGIEYHPVVIGHGVPTRDAHPQLFE
ncbi:hypothetical protein EQG49_07585 [Periweissella cryptocerci]|uniref:Uncharacterized protein n=1 Tax=Periweissella cryptocerci TaxID=2506420 RepID=A0A4P6YU70_9LACO|nr:hypothetical protein [Periweissella cryptocerci]QBO36329.1 hypothetical protein EQG49_07585 [Periweissella cryptocerci]